ncbi:omega-hydroxypalmitate O-feruloyl transferase-like isoform X1 [Cryptomeria japonica]|uniref:omega-hydroxypalmitate O-feruloyl transferase-like isoform X1 n=1 Tax=Cryptomeria japonica TaxID=3369 RepID=UPI0027DA6AE4|nr:omega-hydroxypalmitate O-feruloyl transferase-like isoform X1 [Cryptomeria japonica]
MSDVSRDFERAVEKMKKSLSDALVHFYPLAGRLATSPEGFVYIDCNDRGADFIEASAPDIRVSEVMNETVSDVVGELFALNGALNMDAHSLPLLVVQLNISKHKYSIREMMKKDHLAKK